MPWGDGTGPRGEGPMTGRGLGYCAGYDMPGYQNPENPYRKPAGVAPRRGAARRRRTPVGGRQAVGVIGRVSTRDESRRSSMGTRREIEETIDRLLGEQGTEQGAGVAPGSKVKGVSDAGAFTGVVVDIAPDQSTVTVDTGSGTIVVPFSSVDVVGEIA